MAKRKPKIQPITFTKALFLENGLWEDKIEPPIVPYVKRYLDEANIPTKIVARASVFPEKVIKEIEWCDAVIFHSTFTYGDEVKGVGDLLKKVSKPLQVYGSANMGNPGQLQRRIENIWSLQELAELSRHRVFEIISTPHTGLDRVWYNEIDMSVYKTQWETKQKAIYDKNHSYKPTGRKVRIEDLEAFGAQWSLLEKGMIVDELDCSDIDPNPDRGIWVMGKDEPVKLLDERNAREYKIVKGY